MVDYEDRLPPAVAGLFKADPARWLLKARSPLVKYRTYIDLLGYPPEHRKPASLLPHLNEDPDLRAVVDSQAADGTWRTDDPFFERSSGPPDLYGPKYIATVWQLPILADLGLTLNDDAPARAYEHIVQRTTSDGFFDLTGKGHGLVRGNAVVCASFVRMGWGAGDFAGPLSWLAARQRPDGGWADAVEIREPDAPSPLATTAHVTLALGYGSRKADGGLYRTERRRAVEYLAANLLGDYAGRFHRTRKPWRRMSWPQYGFDALTIAESLRAAGAAEQHLFRAADIVLERQTPKGFWRQRLRFVGNTRIPAVEPGHGSRWLTKKAAELIIAIGRRRKDTLLNAGRIA